ncbi:hypothetical protein C8R47DRAFT_1225394 [Mycena vitilis]|nr:hypothetical protein C8R47DRAFT_1225394 [Mycena vitilis]
MVALAFTSGGLAFAAGSSTSYYFRARFRHFEVDSDVDRQGQHSCRFPRGLTPPLGKSLIGAEISVAADNTLNFCSNGDYVGSGKKFSANASAISTVGGLYPPHVLQYAAQRADGLYRGRVFVDRKGAIPVEFEQPRFDDSAWPAIAGDAVYPAAPWGAISLAALSAAVTV